eukprot:TRINITY_DN24063_c0_g1_i2.p1 TRINITY_DN24063_c0_g1~~TRINITY_DN24063_c0_g1_i2.p1  ORF type:complete len:232 (+),score=55.67 TRINITY_DN24063_c0_g1_i2:477-1172(+)
MKLTESSPDAEVAAQASFVRAYARYLEERTSLALSGALRGRLEQTPLLIRELSAMAPADAVAATAALLQLLSACTEVGCDPAWADNAATMYALGLCLQDSRLLYLLLTRQCVWLLETASSMNQADRAAGADVFEGFVRLHDRLGKVYHGARQLAARGLLPSDTIPELRPLPAMGASNIRSMVTDGVHEDPEEADLPEVQPLPAEMLAAPPTELPAAAAGPQFTLAPPPGVR